MNSLQLAWLDLKRLGRSRFLRIALLALSLMPLLYSFLYLYASWDPYGKLNHLPVAIVNEDQGGLLNNQPENFGQQLVNKLQANHDVQWEPVTRAVAERGLESGHYYLALFVPPDLTTKVLTATDAHPQQAEIVYVSNQGASYLASSIGKKLMAEVKTQFATEISGTFFTNTLIAMRDGSTGLMAAADGAHSLADGGAQALAGAADLQSGTTALQAGASRLATGVGAAQVGANRLTGGLQVARDQLAAAGQGAAQLHAGIQRAGQGSAQLVSGLGQLQVGMQQFGGGVDQLATGLNGLQSGLADPQRGVPALVGGAQQVSAGIDRLNQAVAQGLTRLDGGIKQSAQGLAGVQALLQQYAATNPAAATDPAFQRALATLGQTKSGLTDQMAPALDQMRQQTPAGFQQLTQGQAQVTKGLTQLQGSVSGAMTQLTAGATLLSGKAEQLQVGLRQAHNGADQLDGGLVQLNAGSAQLAQGLADPSGMNRLVAGGQSLTAALSQLGAGGDRLAAGLSDLHHGTAQLSDGLLQLRDGNATLATRLSQAANQMQDQSKGDAALRGKALADPVALVDQPIHEVKEYGTGFAPYFTPLSLWVGAMLLFFVIGIKENRLRASLVPAHVLVLSKFWTLAAVGTVQAVITSWVMLTFLGLHTQSVWQLYAFTILISWAFIAIIQLLVSLAGMVGRFLAIVLLMLQLTSCAGTFPIELLPRFFQVLHPFAPMTYATAGLRQIISGSSTETMATCLWVLGGCLVGALALNMFTANRYVTIRDLHPSQELAV